VDLVHFARLRMADDDAGPIDAERALALLAHDALGIVLGTEVRVVQALGLVEHVLAKYPRVQARCGNRTDMMEAACFQGFRELDRVARAFDIRPHLAFLARRKIVQGSQVKEMPDLARSEEHTSE